MAGVCCRGETETSAPVEPSSKAAMRRRMEIHQFKFLGAADIAPPPTEGGDRKRQRLEIVFTGKNVQQRCADGIEDRAMGDKGKMVEKGDSKASETSSSSAVKIGVEIVGECPNFGMTSVCGRRRDMEDAVAIHPSFSRRSGPDAADFHFFGVYDGHGCSHVRPWSSPSLIIVFMSFSTPPRPVKLLRYENYVQFFTLTFRFLLHCSKVLV